MHASLHLPQDGDMALFSSIGPGVGQRVKPDVVAPGFSVTSANSNAATAANPCPLTGMAGTSMATPITAGDVALVRQYFREGWYPTGTKGTGVASTPSGALMKAMIVHSGVDLSAQGPLGQGTFRGQPITPRPSNIQGFGRVQLNRVLFQQEPSGKSPGQRILVIDDSTRPITATGVEHTVEIGGAAAQPADPILGTEFKATLVWTDAPAQPLDNTPLINNLDLVVTVGGQTLRGNGGTAADQANTVEQVVLPSVPPNTPITVTVRGGNVQQGPQKYALVISGPLAGLESPPPARPRPPPPLPPREPGYNDTVALGFTVPLLFLAVGAGGMFLFRRPPPDDGSGSGSGLPPGWKQLKDPSSGAPYFLNEKTGATQWEAPPPVAPKEAAPPVSSGLPAPWTAVADPTSGRTYYYNSQTGQSQWVAPTA